MQIKSLPPLIWTLAAFCVLLTIGRYVIRYAVRRRFFWDDLAHLVALICLLSSTIILQELLAVHDLDASTVRRVLRLEIASSILLLAGLWAVKAAFLCFYYELFQVSTTFRRGLWVVSVFVFICWWASFAGVLAAFGLAQHEYDITAASTSSYQRRMFICTCVFNVATDIAVMVLPMFMLFRIHIHHAKKVGIALLFGVTFVTIALDILRTAEGYHDGDASLYSMLEINFAVIISCAPTYRSLFGREGSVKWKKYAQGRSFESRHGARTTFGGLSEEEMSSTALHKIEHWSRRPSEVEDPGTKVDLQLEAMPQIPSRALAQTNGWDSMSRNPRGSKD